MVKTFESERRYLLIRVVPLWIEDNVLIALKVNLVNDPSERRATTLKPIVIKKGAWIGVAATDMPSVTMGGNSIIWLVP